MKAKHAYEIRKGIRAARNYLFFEGYAKQQTIVHALFVRTATQLSYRAYVREIGRIASGGKLKGT